MTLRNVTWVLTPGEPGMRSQALGLAEAVGLPIEEKRAAVRAPYSWLPGGLLPMPRWALEPPGDTLAPPWPRLVIACGRRAIGPALAVKRLSRGRTLTAYIQNPEWGCGTFDLVAAMPHDGVTGPNVVTVPTALHGVTQDRLAKAGEHWGPSLAADHQPFLGVLLGGDNGGYRLTDGVAEQLLRILRAAQLEHGMPAVVTPSRRTPDRIDRLITGALNAEGLGWMWDETGENPYLGILARAGRLIVTAESISMISEALATGHPVHVLPLEGGGRRHDAFLSRIVKERLVSRIDGDDLDWSFAGVGPVISTAEPAARLKAMLKHLPVV